MGRDFLIKRLAREVTGMGPRTDWQSIRRHSPDGELHGSEICYPYLGGSYCQAKELCCPANATCFGSVSVTVNSSWWNKVVKVPYFTLPYLGRL